MNHYIKKISIQSVRHLSNIEIHIGKNEDDTPRHLMITGPNGSGKTSLILAIRNYLQGIPTRELLHAEEWRQALFSSQMDVKTFEQQLLEANDDERLSILSNKFNAEQQASHYSQLIKDFTDIALDVGEVEDLIPAYQSGRFVLVHFGAKRENAMELSPMISKVDFKAQYDLAENGRGVFIKFIVGLKAKRAFARDAGDLETAKDIDLWFEKFENALRNVFEDDGLKLIFDVNSFNFLIQLSDGRDAFDLNQLSDGYQSILSILTELIVRMENYTSKLYSQPGIVLIDEVENHLHVELQKKILPFLTSFFPKIQFVVTTHSPFVLNSIKNAVAFDLKNKELIEDLSGYPYDAILEGYFGESRYSDLITQKVERYRQLVTAAEKSKDEIVEFALLRHELNALRTLFSELDAALSEIEASVK